VPKDDQLFRVADYLCALKGSVALDPIFPRRNLVAARGNGDGELAVFAAACGLCNLPKPGGEVGLGCRAISTCATKDVSGLGGSSEAIHLTGCLSGNRMRQVDAEKTNKKAEGQYGKSLHLISFAFIIICLAFSPLVLAAHKNGTTCPQHRECSMNVCTL
jgi:hypothetical protein